jgi:hypothetical protein
MGEQIMSDDRPDDNAIMAAMRAAGIEPQYARPDRSIDELGLPIKKAVTSWIAWNKRPPLFLYGEAHKPAAQLVARLLYINRKHPFVMPAHLLGQDNDSDIYDRIRDAGALVLTGLTSLAEGSCSRDKREVIEYRIDTLLLTGKIVVFSGDCLPYKDRRWSLGFSIPLERQCNVIECGAGCWKGLEKFSKEEEAE